MIELFNPHFYIDFMGKFWRFALPSGLLIVASIVSLSLKGLNYGIDFAGGYEIQIKLPNPATEAEIKEALASVGVEGPRVQRYGAQNGTEYLILVREQATVAAADKLALKQELAALAGGLDNLTDWSSAESGESFKVGFSQPVTEAQVRGVVEKRGLAIANISGNGRDDKPAYSVELVSLGSKIQQGLVASLKLPADTKIASKVEFVGPQVGSQLRTQGIMAVIYALAFLLIYIAVRFDFYFSPGAIIATLHDVIIVMGVFSFFEVEFTLSSVAAVLTLIGYSLNDTVVVYDRIRENVAKYRGRELRHVVSGAISETLSRTILTSVVTLFVVVALLVFGGRTLMDFSLGLLVGIIVGTYSSIAIAAPTYVLLREHYDRRVVADKAAVAAG